MAADKPDIYHVRYLGADGEVLIEPQPPYTMPYDPVTVAKRRVVQVAGYLYERKNARLRRGMLESIERSYVAQGRRPPLALPENVARVRVSTARGYEAAYDLKHYDWRPAQLRMPAELPEANASGRPYDPRVLDWAMQTFEAEWAPDALCLTEPGTARPRAFVRFLQDLPPDRDGDAGKYAGLPREERRALAREVGRALLSVFLPGSNLMASGQALRYAYLEVVGARKYPAPPPEAQARAAAKVARALGERLAGGGAGGGTASVAAADGSAVRAAAAGGGNGRKRQKGRRR